MPQSNTRRLAAVMFTDIVGYTALMQSDEQFAATLRKVHRQEFSRCHNEFNGEILHYFGDGTLSVFESAVQAVECAIAIQKSLTADPKVPLRIGIHLGDIVFDEIEVFGDGVNVASRIENVGVAGGVLISSKVNDELRNQTHIQTSSLGHFHFKNVRKAIEVFAVENEGVKVPARSELKEKPTEYTRSIAVLPFVNMSSNKENEYFSDGMTEEIINALTKIRGLRVTSRTSSFFFKNKNIPIQQIGKELNVSTILEGSIRLAGDQLRITAQLIDVSDDYHFWSETFDRSLKDVFAVQDEISLLIADRLREHVGHFEIEDQLVVEPDISVNAYTQYLRGRFHVLKMSKPDLEKGMDLFQNIIASQPQFALAHLGMHLGYSLLGMVGLMSAEEAFVKGDVFLKKAISIDANLPECQLHLSYKAFLQEWDFSKSYKHLQRSFEIRTMAEYYPSMASILVAERKFKAAHQYIDTALQLDPFSEIHHHLKGFIFYCQEQYREAIRYFDKAIQLKPEFLPPSFYKGQALLLQDKAVEALECYQALPHYVGSITLTGYLTMAYAALNDKKSTVAGIAKLEDALMSSDSGGARNALISVYAVLGEYEKALDYLEKAVTLRNPMMVYIYSEPLWKKLHNYPRFQSLLKRVIGETTDFELSGSRYRKPLLDENSIEQYRKQLTELMDLEKPFLNPTLTLRDLADIMNIPANHLSQLLNEGFDKNFAEYVNAYRLEAFKEKVADPKLRHLTILALAFESGFNSKTVFNTFFKKTMSMTPKAYWKTVIGSDS
ncbi:MAG: adenylate/guanylate cyclase domain-containing protein [Bacteroidia bacterium]